MLLLIVAGCALALHAGAAVASRRDAGEARFARSVIEIGKRRDDAYRARARSPLAVRAAVTPARDWQAQVDAAWGAGLPTGRKLEIFDAFWKAIDERYASWQGLNVDWAALRARYRPQVAAGVSRGRFAQIMMYMALELRDSHVAPFDRVVWGPLFPGFPIIGVGQWFGNNSGTCGTAQPDGSTLIYSAVRNHPLGLQAGDSILGFDGRPWRENLDELLAARLPLSPIFWGSSPSSYDDTFMSVANINWHLFRTMDVRKFETGEVQHRSTAPLQSEPFSGDCSEQLDIPGVPKPDFFSGDDVSWGVVRGTHIGYIYVWAWRDPAGAEFTAAVKSLTQDRRTDGLIIDHRFDLGGYLGADDDGLDMLFKGEPAVEGLDTRADPLDHLRMRLAAPPSLFRIGGRDGKPDPRAYDRPIAVLTGPGTVSMGDHAVLRLRRHPRVRTFGKPEASAFGPVARLDVDDDWLIHYPFDDAWRLGERHDYLTREEIAPDQAVWLRPADVAHGRDTVVDAAIAWIEGSRANDFRLRANR